MLIITEIFKLNLFYFALVVNNSSTRKLTWCIWTLCCMIEVDRVSLGGILNEFIRNNYIIFFLCLLVLNRCINREHFSTLPIDFEQKPITIESLNEQDVIVN